MASQLFFMLRLLAASLLASGCSAQDPEASVIRSGVPWYDTQGNRIYAGGANMYLEKGVYYLVGEGKKVLSGDCSDCFNLYKSVDLVAWDFVECVVKNENIVGPPGTSFPFRMERPKIFKCPATQKYMLWFHCDTPGFGIQSVGVLQADAVAGPYAFVSPCFKPDGEKSYDMGTFVDDAARGGDGRAYLIRSVNNQFAGISQMTEDCTNVTGIVSSGPDMEGQALMRDAEGVLHAAGSHLTGWAPNAAQFVTSPNATLVGAQWENNINPSGDATTYETQSTFIFPFQHADGHTTFIWMAGLANMTNVFLPLIPPTNSSQPPSYAGAVLAEATCDATAPAQRFAMPAAGGGAIVHGASGLCVRSDAGVLSLGTCAGATEWRVGAQGSILSADGSMCWNAADDKDHVPGNPVVPYPPHHPPAWNEQWTLPAPGATGVIQATLSYSGGPSNLCVAAAASVPSWTLPWLDSWSLKDY